MPHKRNGRIARQARRERALDRWIANRDRNYHGISISAISDPKYVDGQIDILLERV